MKTGVRIRCIVEGDGEVLAVPILVRRVAADVDPGLSVDLGVPIRVKRNLVVKSGELERYVELASRKLTGPGGILVLLDSDKDCPATLAPALQRRAEAIIPPQVSIAVVLAVHEFEAWFLAAAISLRGARGLPANLEPPPSPESLPGAKGWMARNLGRKYRETQDQPALAARLDMKAARSARSFDKFYKEVYGLLHILTGASHI